MPRRTDLHVPFSERHDHPEHTCGKHCGEPTPTLQPWPTDRTGPNLGAALPALIVLGVLVAAIVAGVVWLARAAASLPPTCL